MPKLFKEEEGAGEEKGEFARLSVLTGSIAVADLVKSTLGPKGMDKILQPVGEDMASSKITITNDGATILKSVYVDNPAAKILIDISKTQDDEVGDGTTSVVVMAGELLREAEKLLEMRIHPQVIIRGYRKSVEAAKAALAASAIDNSKDPQKFREDLYNIACTTLSSKILTAYKDHFANLAVDAVLRLKGSTNLEAIQIIKIQGGALQDSYLDSGFILKKKMGVGQPKTVKNARILVANTPMDTDKVKIYAARARVDSLDRVAEIEAAEKGKMKAKVEKILKHDIKYLV
jgi:T-complex protein 1 subunit beta